MRSLQRLGAVLLAVPMVTTACGGNREAAGHATEAMAPPLPPPTPDTTPIQALRTPAGIALKMDTPRAAVTPEPTVKEVPPK